MRKDIFWGLVNFFLAFTYFIGIVFYAFTGDWIKVSIQAVFLLIIIKINL